MAMTTPNRVFEDFEPPSDLVPQPDCDTILVHLPGFKKDQLRVQLTTSRILKISGQRPIGDNKWKRFQKEFTVSSNCNTRNITAKLEGGILYIRQPKLPSTTTTTTAPPPISAKQPTVPPQQPPPPQPQTPPRPQPQPQTQPSKAIEMASKIDERPKTDGHEMSTVEQGGWKLMIAKSSGLFRELRNPGNLKKLVVSVLVVLIVGGFISHLYNSYTGEKQPNLVQYDQEL